MDLARQILRASAVLAASVTLAAPATAGAQQPASSTPPPQTSAPLPPAPPPPASPPGIRGRILTIARNQIGYHDHGSYCNRYGPCEVWCALFATWVWQRADVPIGILPFTGSVYDWAAQNTYVLSRRGHPHPGDAVLYGTGPATTDSSVHMGIVEAAYPGYLVTIEGDIAHGVRRFVVPIRNPRRIGETARIYAYASPVPHASASAFAPIARAAAAPSLAGARLRRAIAHQDRLSRRARRMRRTIESLRAFQHMPFTANGLTIEWYAISATGRIEVAVVSDLPLDQAEQAWQLFLARHEDAGAAYDVGYFSASG